MKRRDFVRGTLALGAGLEWSAGGRAAEPEKPKRALVVDCHCHAGRGLNFGKDEHVTDPWTTYNDPKRTLHQAAEVGIDRSVIFPINNTIYEQANKEIAGYVRQYPDRLIGFAKHDPKTEA